MPLAWQWSARQFVCAANILRAQCEAKDLFEPGAPGWNSLWKPHNVVRLLYGLALENLLKGLLVAQGTDATSTGKLNKILKTHDLVSLWTRANLPLTDQTKDTLRNLRWSIETGKYPVGTSPNSSDSQPFGVALTSIHKIAGLLQKVEDALRDRQPSAFERQT
jgi:hypothetical protein